MSNKPSQVAYCTDRHGVTHLVGRVGGTSQNPTYGGQPAYWQPNTVFSATMEFIANGAFFVIDIATGIKYPMFPSDVLDCIKRDVIRKGQITGDWQVVKRNTAYAIQLV